MANLKIVSTAISYIENIITTTPQNIVSKKIVSVNSLSQALTRLAVSPVQADQKAIQRLEREYGKDITEIIKEVDNADLAIEYVLDQRDIRNHKLAGFYKTLIVIAGASFVCAAFFSMFMPLFCMAFLGLGVGAFIGTFIGYLKLD